MKYQVLLVSIVASVLLAGGAQAQADSLVMAWGRQYTQWWYEAQDDKLWEKFSEQMRAAVGGGADKIPGVRQSIAAQVGEETELLEERVVATQGLKVYLRRTRYSAYNGVILVSVAVDATGGLMGFQVTPEQQ